MAALNPLMEKMNNWNLNFRRSLRLQKMVKRTTMKMKEAKVRLQRRRRRKIKARRRRNSLNRLIHLRFLSLSSSHLGEFPEEKRELEHLEKPIYNSVRQAAEVHRQVHFFFTK
ncbi:unnamed protein product [Arabidopsis halleri]